MNPTQLSTGDSLALVTANGRSIGSIVSEANNLTPEQVESVLKYQRENGVRFGEAAVALGFVKPRDVVWALAQQFSYPYVSPESTGISADLITALDPFSAPAESFRDVRSHILQSNAENSSGRRALAVVSANHGDGRTHTAANLAVTFSQLGARTVLIDADMRNPGLHKLFNVESSNGLSSVLAGRGEANVVQPIKELENLFLLPVGVTPPNPLELVQGRAFTQLLLDLVLKFDQVIVDTPAYCRGADSKVIARQCGEAIAVARPGKSRISDLKDMVATLNKAQFNFHGIIKNSH